MVPEVNNYCDPSMYYLKCPFETNKTCIVVHNTGMPSPARNEVSYMIRNTDEVSFHDCIDESEIVHGIPYTRNVWGTGDGRGEGNMHGIQIEIARSTHENEALFRQAEINAAEYIAHLLKERNWGIEKVKKHQDFNGKYCPHKTLDWGWNRFLSMIKNFMEEEETVTYEQFKDYMNRYTKELAEKPVDDWAKESWKKVSDANIMDGSRPCSFVKREELATVLDRIESSTT